MMRRLIARRTFQLVYENEEQQQEEQQENKQEEKKEEEKKEVKKEGRLFTQEEVNRTLGEDRRKNQKNREETIQQLKNLRDTVQLTEKQKEELESRIEQLTTETLTAQEVAKRDKEKLSKEFDRERTKVVAERDNWRSLYTAEKIQRELIDSAIEHKAISPTQIVNFLTTNTKLVEELKDGKPTGKWVSRVTYYDKDDKTGEPVTLELSVTEAVKRMSEAQEHWNLFNSGANGGTGSFNTNTGAASLRGKQPPKDPLLYRKWREENIGKGIKK